MNCGIIIQFCVAYAVSTIGGQIVLAPSIEFMRRRLGSQTDRDWVVSFAVGITERAIATTLVIGAPSLLAPFIGGWTAAKIAAGWGRIVSSEPVIRSSHLVALVGTAISFAIAIAAGLWAHPASLIYFAK